MPSPGLLSCAVGHRFDIHDGVSHLLPVSIDSLTAEEGRYHDSQKHEWAELNQIHTVRNLYFHRSVLKFISEKSGGNVLELGGGIGFDLDLFLKMRPSFNNYVFSEVSDNLVAFVARNIKCEGVMYCTIEARHIPFADGQFDCVYMMAALHHMPDAPAALREMTRVTKSGGMICCGMEPNRGWLQLLAKNRWLVRSVIAQRNHSPADEEATGFCIRDFKTLGEACDLKLMQVKPVWLLCGFAHYGFELLYRLFRLKSRITLPVGVETVLVFFDNVLLRIPGLKHVCWHYSVVYQKR